MELEKVFLSEVTQTGKRRIWYMFNHKKRLIVKSRITDPEKLGNKESSKGDTQISLRRGNRKGIMNKMQTGVYVNIKIQIRGHKDCKY